MRIPTRPSARASGILLAGALALAGPARAQLSAEQVASCDVRASEDACRASFPAPPAEPIARSAAPLPTSIRPARTARMDGGRVHAAHPREWDRGVWIGAGVGCLAVGAYVALGTNIHDMRPAVARGCAIGALAGGLVGYATRPARR